MTSLVCGASAPSLVSDATLGPCVLIGHPATVAHKAADGTTWLNPDAAPIRTGAELIELAEVERLVLKPGDVLVVKTAQGTSSDDLHDYGELLGKVFPDNEILLMAPGMAVTVLEQSADPA